MNMLGRTLAGIGRLGARGLALSLVIAAIVPGAAILKPLLPGLVIIFVTLNFIRIDMTRLRAVARAPGRLAFAIVWMILAAPLAGWLIFTLLGRDGLDPDLVAGVALQLAAPPILALTAISLLLGVEATFGMTALTAATLLSPLTAPFAAQLVAGPGVALDGWAMARNLAVMLAVATAISALIRSRASLADIERRKAPIDGFNVLFFGLFAAMVLDGALWKAAAKPATALLYIAVAAAISLAGLLAGYRAQRAASGGAAATQLDRGDAFVVGLSTGLRNMALVIGALGGEVSPGVWLYFGLSQLPIYILPFVVEPLARRIVGRASH